MQDNATLGQTFGQRARLDFGNGADMFGGQRVKYHDIIEAIDEFRAEMRLHRTHHRRLHLGVGFRTQPLALGDFLDVLRAEVRGHHDYRIAEIDGAALTVGQAAVVEHLQQDIEHIRMRLLDFIKQDHRIWTPAHGFREVTAFFITDVARRRTDQARHRMLFHELTHVDADHGIGTVEQELGQGLAQFGLADTGRAQKQERAIRPVRIGQAGTRTPDGGGHRSHRFVLADDLAVQLAFHTQQFFAFAFQHLADRDAGPARYHFRDFIGGHFILQQFEAVGLDRHGRTQLLFQIRDAPVLDLAHQGDVLLALRGIQFKARLLQLLLDAGGAGQGGFFGFPDFLQIAELAFQLVDFLLEIVQTLLGFAVLFFLQGFPLHF